MVAFFITMLTCTIGVILFAVYRVVVVEGVKHFANDVRWRQIDDVPMNRYLINHFKLRQVTTPHRGIRIEYKTPFSGWRELETYNALQCTNGTIQTEVAKLWDTIDRFKTHMAFVPESSPLIHP